MLGCCYAHRFHPAVPGAALRSAGKSMKYTGGCGRAGRGETRRTRRQGDKYYGRIINYFWMFNKMHELAVLGDGRCGPCQCNNGAMVPSIKVSSVAASCSSTLHEKLKIGKF